MRAKHWLLCTAILVSCLTSLTSAQEAVRWRQTLETAKREASQTNRLVLVHFGATWCPACRKMEREVFTQPNVASAVEASFVPVKLNTDHFPHTAKQYGVRNLPSDVIITPQGQMIDMLVGAAPATRYVASLNQIALKQRQASAPQYAGQPATPPVAANQFAGQPNPVSRAAASNAAYSPPSQLSDSRYADYFGNRQSLEPASVRPPYANSVNPAPTNTQPPTRFASPAPTNTQPPTRFASPAPTDTQPPTRFAPPGPGNMPPVVSVAPDRRDLAGPSAVTVPAQPSYGVQPSFPQNPTLVAAQPPADPTRQPTPRFDRGFGVPAEGTTVSSPEPTAVAGLALPIASASAPPADAPASSVQLPTGSPPLALDGYCPVNLTEKERWVLGNPRWGLTHRGRTYLFAGPDEQSRFYADPDHFAPALSGNDAVLAIDQNRMVPGRREHGAWFAGRVFLFSTEQSFQQFTAAPQRYVDAVLNQPTSETTPNVNARRPASVGMPSRAY